MANYVKAEERPGWDKVRQGYHTDNHFSTSSLSAFGAE
jgi:hypothetical protein